MKNFLTKIHARLNRNRRETVRCENVEEDLAWLKMLPNPTDMVEASYLQYLCQSKDNNSLKTTLLNIAAFIALTLLLHLPCKKPAFVEDHDICFYLPNAQYLPVRDNIEMITDYGKYYLTKSQVSRFKRDMSRVKRAYYFKLKLLIKAGMYGYYIQCFNPKIVYCSSEYSYCSSYLTLFCNREGIKNCDVQHGEKGLNISNSFCTFDVMYVWDAEYISLFKQLRSCTREFRVFTPEFLKPIDQGHRVVFDFKYYMQNQTKEEMEMIGSIVRLLRKNGYTAEIRMHPAYPNLAFESKFRDVIESPKSIDESIGETRAVISQCSTVLLQGLYAGKTVIVDDVSSPKTFENLKKVGYIMLRKGVPTLSQVLNRGNNNEIIS